MRIKPSLSMLLGYSVRWFPIRVSVIAGLDVRHIMLASHIQFAVPVTVIVFKPVLKLGVGLTVLVRRCREAVAPLFERAILVLAHCDVRHGLGRLLGRLLGRSVVRDFRICQGKRSSQPVRVSFTFVGRLSASHIAGSIYISK